MKHEPKLVNWLLKHLSESTLPQEYPVGFTDAVMAELKRDSAGKRLNRIDPQLLEEHLDYMIESDLIDGAVSRNQGNIFKVVVTRVRAKGHDRLVARRWKTRAKILMSRIVNKFVENLVSYFGGVVSGVLLILAGDKIMHWLTGS